MDVGKPEVMARSGLLESLPVAPSLGWNRQGVRNGHICGVTQGKELQRSSHRLCAMQVRGTARSRDLTAILPDANTVALDLFLRRRFF